MAMQEPIGVCRRGCTLLEQGRSRQLLVTRHAEAEADRRGLDREATDEDRRCDDEQIHRRERVREVRVDDLRRPERALDRRAHVRHRHQRRPEEDGADDESADDRGEDGLGRLASRVPRLLRERRRGVEAVDHVEAHEHRHEERADRERLTVRVEDHADALVVVEDREDEREDDHPEDLEDHAGVVDQRHEPHAEDVQDRDPCECHDRDDPLVVEAVRDVPAHAVERRDERQRERHAHGGDGQDAGEQVDPAGEPGVRLPGQILGPLEHRPCDRIVARQLREGQGDDELAQRDDRPAPEEDAADCRQAQEEEREDAGRRRDVAERDGERAEDAETCGEAPACSRSGRDRPRRETLRAASRRGCPPCGCPPS